MTRQPSSHTTAAAAFHQEDNGDSCLGTHFLEWNTLLNMRKSGIRNIYMRWFRRWIVVSLGSVATHFRCYIHCSQSIFVNEKHLGFNHGLFIQDLTGPYVRLSTWQGHQIQQLWPLYENKSIYAHLVCSKWAVMHIRAVWEHIFRSLTIFYRVVFNYYYLPCILLRYCSLVTSELLPYKKKEMKWANVRSC